MRLLKTTDRSFEKNFRQIIDRNLEGGGAVEKKVRSILEAVKRRGDRALIGYTRRYDRWTPTSLEVTPREIAAARRQVGRRELADLRLAARRIERFHRRQKTRSWSLSQGGLTTGEIVRAIDRVGIYVPGGTAAYPSTVLMNAIPARVAGVPEIIMVTPFNQGLAPPATLAAAAIAGVDRIFKIGGAQAIGALAYGTETVPAVDKIVGPGNIFVTTAKRVVAGQVGIDGLAGPTELVIVADDKAPPDLVAADLLSQAEHDERALVVLVTSSTRLVEKVRKEVAQQMEPLSRREILKKTMARRWVVLVTRNLAESIEIANRIAPEHLELQVQNPARWLFYIRHAGAIFLGPHAPVALGDYVAGPNHVLPTGGTARFASPLGVADFLKRSSLIDVRESGLKKLGPSVIRLAEMEQLTAHAASVRLRLGGRP